MRVALFCINDLTTNTIFAPVFDVPGVEIAGLFFMGTVNHKHRSKLGAAFSVLRKTHWRYGAYLVFTHGLYQVFELLTLKLGLRSRCGSCVSLKRLAQERNVPCEIIPDFGAPEFIERITAMQLDMLLIRVGAILKPEMLAAPKLATWCVHSSLLPSFKGIAGEFHALRTPGAPIGSTVFRVAPKLDEGPPLAQVTIVRDEKRSVFNHMLRNNSAASALLSTMLLHTARGETATYDLPGLQLPGSYFSWPQPAHMREARQHGISLIRLWEWFCLLLQALHLHARPLINVDSPEETT